MPRIAQIYKAYRMHGGMAPFVKSASFVAVGEVLAMPLVGAQQVTVLAPTLRRVCHTATLILLSSDAYWPAKYYDLELPPSLSYSWPSTRCDRTVLRRPSISTSTTSQTTQTPSIRPLQRTQRPTVGCGTPLRPSRASRRRRKPSSSLLWLSRRGSDYGGQMPVRRPFSLQPPLDCQYRPVTRDIT